MEFELWDDIPGLKYQQGVEAGWTPVRHRRKRNKSTQSSGSESDGVMEQWIQRAKKIDYEVSEEDDQPGITVYTRNMLHWFPVKPDPTPVARRTRASYMYVSVVSGDDGRVGSCMSCDGRKRLSSNSIKSLIAITCTRHKLATGPLFVIIILATCMQRTPSVPNNWFLTVYIRIPIC